MTRRVDGECSLFYLTRGGRFTLLDFGALAAAEVLPSALGSALGRAFPVVEAAVGSDDLVASGG